MRFRCCVALLSLAFLAACTSGTGNRRLRPRTDAGSMVVETDGGSTAGPDQCTPGQTACDGATFYRCDSDGMSRREVVECEASCDAVEGCVACEPGERRCDGTASMVCAPSGSRFVFSRDCAEAGSTCGGTGYCSDPCGEAESSKSNVGCEYWPVPLANSPDLAGRYDFRVVVANPDASSPANVRVYQGDTMVRSATVPASGLDDIVLPWVDGMSNAVEPPNWSSASTPQGAYRLVSDRPVTVAQFNPFEYDNGQTIPDPRNPLGPPVPDYSFSNDASILLPAHSFTGDYIASSFTPLSTTQDVPGLLPGQRTRQSGAWPGYIAVVGVTPEPTSVQIQLTAPVAGDSRGKFPATPAGGTLSFTVARGEVVQVMAAVPPACEPGRPGHRRESRGPNVFQEFCDERSFDLSGSRVAADHPLAVFGGHACAYVPYDATACDHLESQLPPLETWGETYVTGPVGVPGPTMMNVVRVTAAADGTTVSVDPPQDGVSSIELGAGEWQEFQATTPFQVIGSGAIMVTQFMVGQFASDPPADNGDPAMMVLPPIEQYRDNYTFVTPTSYNERTDGQSYVLIVREAGAEVRLDGNAVAPTWTTVGEREVGIVEVSGGTHRMEGPMEFGAMVYGMGVFTSYAYAAGLNLEEILII